MNDNKPLAVLTKYSAISAGLVAALIALGFVVQVRLTQLLGTDLPSAPTDYLAAAGDFLMSFVVRLSGIIFSRDFTMTRLHLITGSSGAIATILGVALGRDAAVWWRRQVVRLCFVLVGIGAVALLLWTIALVRLHDVLQPANETHTVQRLQRMENVEADTGLRLIVDAYKHPSSTLQDQVAKACFNPATGHTAEHRQNLYAGTILAAILLLIAVRTVPRGTDTALQAALLGIAWFAVVLSLPLTYATLGRNFTFPVVRITGSQVATYCGYLLAADAGSITLYDRPAGFRLRRIPREHLLIDQLGTASPFQGCGSVPNDPEGFMPCETLFCSP